MRDAADEVIHEMGRALRDARIRRRWRLVDVAGATGLSTSALSRMELGQAGAAPIRDWVEVAALLGVGCFQVPGEDVAVLIGSLAAIMVPGGWVETGRHGAITWFDRSGDWITSLRTTRWPAERLVVHVVSVLTDLRASFDTLADAVSTVAVTTPAGVVVGGVLVVQRTTNNRRRASPERRRSHPMWSAALRTPRVRVPVARGLVWLAPRGTHIQPVG